MSNTINHAAYPFAPAPAPARAATAHFGRRLMASLRSMLLRRACQAAKAKLGGIGDARIRIIGVDRKHLVDAFDALERTAATKAI